MNQTHTIRAVGLSLVVILLISLLSACVNGPDKPIVSDAEESAVVTAPESNAAPPESAETESARLTGDGASARKIFGDYDLPEDQMLYADQVGFRLETDKGVRVQVMDISTLESRLKELEPLPRTRYFEDLLSEDYRLLFSVFDLALELGSVKFCFPTRSLRARDVSEIVEMLNATYPLYDARPRFSVTKDLTDASGEAYRFLTVYLTNCNTEKLQKHHLAVEACRVILRTMPGSYTEDPEEYPLALYSIVVNSVEYESHFDEESNERCPLYNAIVEKHAGPYGISAWFYTIMNLAGYDCLQVSGTTYGGTEENPHAIYTFYWNIAKLGDAYYVFDPTLDNWNSERGYLFFYGLSEEKANERFRRTIDPFFADIVPPCPENFPQDKAPVAPEIGGGTNLSYKTGAHLCLSL